MASLQPELPMDRAAVCAVVGAGAVGLGHVLVVIELRSIIAWLAGGVAAGLLLRWGRRAVWPMPLGSALMAIALGYPLPGALLPAVATFSGAFALATWLEHKDFRADLQRRSDLLRFVAAGLPAAALPPLISMAGLEALGWNSGIADPALRLFTWWSHSVIALLLLAPAIATLSRAQLRSWLDDAGMTALLLASLVLLVAAMLRLPDATVGIWIPPLAVVGTLLATIRRDLVFGSLYALVVVLTFTLGVTDSSPAWVFALVLAASVLATSALLAERSTAQRRVAEAEQHRRLALLEAATGEQQRIGRDLHDTLGQELTAIALMARATEHRARGTPGAGDLVAMAQGVVERCVELVETARRLSRELLAPVDAVAREVATLRAAAGPAGTAQPWRPRPSAAAAPQVAPSSPLPRLAGPALAGLAALLGALGAPLASPLAWVPVGLAAGTTLRWGWLAGGCVLGGNVLGGLVTRQPSAAIAAGTLAAAAGALLFVPVLRRLDFRPGLPRLRDVALFVGAALAAAAAAAAVARWAPQPTPFPIGWMYASIMLLVIGLPCITVTAPAIAGWAHHRNAALALCASILAVMAALLARVPGLQWVALAGLLVVIVGSMRLGVAFAGLGVPALSMSQSVGALLHFGIASLAADLALAGQLWSYALILATVALSMQMLLAEREANERRAREALAEERIGMLGAAIREQERIGRTLEHGLGRGLVALSQQLQQFEAQAWRDAPTVAAEVVEMGRACERALQATFAVAHGLVPPIANDGDLLMAVHGLARRVQAATGTAVTVQAEPGLRLPLESCRDVYRLVQEALNNAVKHAAARTVRIELRRGVADGAQVVIEDDGRGFVPALVAAGLGLRTMEYRAAVAGGNLQVDAVPGRGTRVSCSVPGRRPAAGDGAPRDPPAYLGDPARLVAVGDLLPGGIVQGLP